VLLEAGRNTENEKERTKIELKGNRQKKKHA
jgi:hypothetical protein